MSKQRVCNHEWVVFSTAVGIGALMVECTRCRTFGNVYSPTPEELKEAAQASFGPYLWPDGSRVTIRKGAKRAVLLGRVSTKAQGDNFSLPSQFAAMRTYAEINDFAVLDEIPDTYTGNSAVADRPGGAQIYAYLQSKAIDVVVLFTLDRTARDDDAIEYAIFKRDVKRAGAELHFADTGRAADDLFGGLIEQFKAVGAAEERKKIAERNVQGRQQKVKGTDDKPGKWVGCGHAPYGYRREGRGKTATLQFEPAEAAIVKRIFAMYLGLDGMPPMGMEKIAITLEAEGVPAPHRGRKSSKGWWRESVRLMIVNPRYTGEFYYGELVVHLPELALIDRQTWELAQERRKKNRWMAQRNRKHEYLLAGGYQRCSCGRSMRGTASNYGKDRNRHILYYACCHEKHLGECNERKIRADDADALVWDWLADLLKDDTNLDAGIKRMAERREVELSPKRERLKVVEELIVEAERSVKNLAKALARAKNDVVAETLQDDLDKLGRHLNGLVGERDFLVDYLGQGDLTPEEIDTLKRISSELRTELLDAHYETKRYLIDKLNLRSQLRRDGDERWLEVSCGITIDPCLLPIGSNSTRRSCVKPTGIINSPNRKIIFSACLPLNG